MSSIVKKEWGKTVKVDTLPNILEREKRESLDTHDMVGGGG